MKRRGKKIGWDKRTRVREAREGRKGREWMGERKGGRKGKEGREVKLSVPDH